MRDLSRLLKAKSIALLGGGWAANVIAQLKKSGFEGEIWPVHPKRNEILGVACFSSLEDLPFAPDAAFIGVNREATIGVVRQLVQMGAGGATCFASGFLESESEGSGGAALQQQLVEAAGTMPVLGPNCYGFLNYLDNVCFWPDQHGGLPVESGVGIIAQSSNIAINMTMQRRGLPIGMLVAAGNQAQTSVSDIAMTMLADDRITAIGLYLEGLGDLRQLEQFMQMAREAGKPVVVLKTGKSESAQKAALTHTASMAGSAAFSSALFKHLGMVEVDDVETFLETLKLVHYVGPPDGNSIASVSCSGGEAGLVADLGEDLQIAFRPFTREAEQKLKSELGPIVTIANPLDYHTFIWGDTERMTSVFAAVMEDRFDLVVFILDLPRNDICDPSSYQCAVDAIIAAKQQTGANVAVMSLLAENLDEKLAAHFALFGVTPLNGMRTGLKAIDAAIRAGSHTREADGAPALKFRWIDGRPNVLDEARSKCLLGEAGGNIPRHVTGTDRAEVISRAESELRFPLALKALGISHKSEAGGVILNIRSADELAAAFEAMPPCEGFLCEEMVGDILAELIVGISHHAYGVEMLTIGAGGIYAEILGDSTNVLLPASREAVREAIRSLRMFPMLNGYRGRKVADIEEIVDAVMVIADFAVAQESVIDLDVNPLMVCSDGVVIADALIVLYD